MALGPQYYDPQVARDIDKSLICHSYHSYIEQDLNCYSIIEVKQRYGYSDWLIHTHSGTATLPILNSHIAPGVAVESGSTL